MEFHALTKIYIVYIVRVSIFTQVWVHQTRAAFTKVILIIMMMMTLMINYLKYGWPTKKFSSIFFLSVFFLSIYPYFQPTSLPKIITKHVFMISGSETSRNGFQKIQNLSQGNIQ